MTPEERERLEQDIRARCERTDLAGAAGSAIRGYGPEIFGFLVGFHRSDQDASEVFSIFTERLWKGLPAFGWECSFRTWAYTIARNASMTYRVEARRRARVQSPLPDGSELSRLADKVRTDTQTFLKTQTKSRVAALRDTLPIEDQMLLSLRVDRKLAWDELVRVMHDGDNVLDGDAIKRESARLRKRFQILKEKLVDLVRREGLLGDDR